GTVAGERKSGTAVLVLTKPLTRRRVIVAQIVVQQTFLIGIAGLGGVVCTALTMALFGATPPPRFFLAALLWLVLALLLLSAMTWFSAMLPTQGAAGLGLAFFFISLIAGIWAPISRYSYIGLVSVGRSILAGGHPPLFWPVVTGLAATMLFG